MGVAATFTALGLALAVAPGPTNAGRHELPGAAAVVWQQQEPAPQRGLEPQRRAKLRPQPVVAAPLVEEAADLARMDLRGFGALRSEYVGGKALVAFAGVPFLVGLFAAALRGPDPEIQVDARADGEPIQLPDRGVYTAVGLGMAGTVGMVVAGLTIKSRARQRAFADALDGPTAALHGDGACNIYCERRRVVLARRFDPRFAPSFHAGKLMVVSGALVAVMAPITAAAGASQYAMEFSEFPKRDRVITLSTTAAGLTVAATGLVVSLVSTARVRAAVRGAPMLGRGTVGATMGMRF